MKIISLSVMMILVMTVFSFYLVSAEENVTAEPMLISEVNANTQSTEAVSEEIATIDDEFKQEVSSWDINKEKMKNWFTFNQEKKTQREFKIAKMLLVKARIEAKNNNSQAMDQALEAHNEILERLQNRINERKAEDNSTEEAGKLTGIERAIQEHELRISRLNLLLETENLTAEQRTKIEERIAKAENVTQKLNDQQNEKISKLKLKLMAKGNLTEEQANFVISELQGFNEIEGLKEAVKESRELAKEQREIMREESKEKRELLKEQFKQQREMQKEGLKALKESVKELRKQNRSSDDSENEVEDESGDDSRSGIDDSDDGSNEVEDD